jgi:hypothetical protein
MFSANTITLDCNISTRDADQRITTVIKSDTIPFDFRTIAAEIIEVYIDGRFVSRPGEYGITVYDTANDPAYLFGGSGVMLFDTTSANVNETLYYTIESVTDRDFDYDYFREFTRILNPKYPTHSTKGVPFETYIVSNNSVVFNRPVSGRVKLIHDHTTRDPNEHGAAGQSGITIPVENIQSYDIHQRHFTNARWAGGNGNVSINPYGITNTRFWNRVGDSVYVEPIALTQPCWGYVRPTADRKSLLYVPPTNFRGSETFTYTLLSQKGQAGPPKCITVKVVDDGPVPRINLVVSSNVVTEGNSVTITLETEGLCPGAEYAYEIFGANITSSDFFNFNARPGVYSVGAVDPADNWPIDSTSPGATFILNITSANLNENLYYTIEETTISAAINAPLNGVFRTQGACNGSVASDSIQARIYADYAPEGDEIFTVRLLEQPNIRANVTIQDLLAGYTFTANTNTAGPGNPIQFYFTGIESNEYLGYTFENADGRPIGYGMTARATVV